MPIEQLATILGKAGIVPRMDMPKLMRHWTFCGRVGLSAMTLARSIQAALEIPTGWIGCLTGR